MNEEEIKNKLTEEEYKVLREKGTEAPGSGKYLHEKTPGMYKCKVCGQELFSSETKFDSGTGWPSFDQAIPGAVEYREDPPSQSYGEASRTEVVCSKCKSHLGHVFEDLPSPSFGKASGPIRQDGKPAEKRYCINSVCLDLEPKK